MTIRFTELQAGEIAHKACIVRDDPDLLESYEITEEQASALANAFLAAQRGGAVDVQPEWVDVIVGEIENLIEIAEHNMAIEGPHPHLAYISSMRQAASKVRQAIARAAIAKATGQQ